MSDYDFGPDKMPWEAEIELLPKGSQLSASRFLALLEPEDELTVEEALQYMEDRQIGLDISDLPPVALTGSSALRLKQEAECKTLETVQTGLDANDPLRLYLQELSATPAAGDIQMLAERYLTGEHHLAEQMVTLCLSRVVETALGYTGNGVLLLDLIQEGSVGLWQSILQYAGGDFECYAERYIRWYMVKSIVLNARNAGIGQMLRRSMEDYLDADQRLLTELGRNPTAEEIAELLHITPEEGQTLEKMVTTARSLAQTRQPEQQPEQQEENDQAVEDTAYFQLRQRIAELLSSLSETDAKLLTLRFGLEGGQPMSPVQTGQVLGMTAQEVLLREAAALDKLRGQ